MVERMAVNHQVKGSSPFRGANIFLKNTVDKSMDKMLISFFMIKKKMSFYDHSHYNSSY